MRSVRSAICTSGEPVSPFLVAYFLTTSCLRSALSDIGCLSSLLGHHGSGKRAVRGPGRDVVQLRSRGGEASQRGQRVYTPIRPTCEGNPPKPPLAAAGR